VGGLQIRPDRADKAQPALDGAWRAALLDRDFLVGESFHFELHQFPELIVREPGEEASALGAVSRLAYGCVS